MNLFYVMPVLVAAAVASSCGDDEDGGFGGSLRSDASVFYYNQITSNGAADQSLLTVDVSLTGEDDSDSASGIGYSRGDEGPELRVRIDDANDNDDNSVSLAGENSSGRLFRTRVDLVNNKNYTAVSYGDTGFNTDIALFEQDGGEVSSGARFRVINTVDPEDLDARGFSLRYNDAGTGNYFSTGLRLGQATEYQSTNASSLNLVVARTGVNPEERFARVNCSLSGSRTYDVILASEDPLNPPLSESEADGALVLYCHPQERN
ncbi:hypothetical protein [Alloalcanivorax gelatiniphagus]|uniref:DUF4397 domain-containing protein n=1 Tax=Alloalcanivorax gelatiniphagus TaxID=1194167 RepID=A0ABY2XIX6_9GAMM|nr:hypothetical protein [Alloalcanivorax gelatiniphagus]TMW10984.1 hypothetical protein FGS76_16915 [Alloalcanivorax gelatiniphagus]|tara:strand:+ start:11323 stop:12111 length:789 start_codon:yes stop_codon:yes gene_type:complete